MSDIGLSDDVSTADAQSAGLGGPNQSDSIDADIGTGRTDNRTNISNVGRDSNLTYSPALATEIAISRGLDPRGLKGFDTLPSNLSFPSLPGNPSLAGLGYNTNISMNPLAQIDTRSAVGKGFEKAFGLVGNMPLSQVPDMIGYNKNSLENLSLAQIDNLAKTDPAGLASLMEAVDISRGNPYGTTADQLGYTGSIASMLGLAKGPEDIDYNMSLKDAIETARSGLAYGTVPGQDVANFGQMSGISDQFSKDMSSISMDKIGKDFSAAGKGIANLATEAFTEVKDAVQEAFSFAKNPYGGSKMPSGTALGKKADVGIAQLDPIGKDFMSQEGLLY